jgi:AAA family ATP:ADP antiporter
MASGNPFKALLEIRRREAPLTLAMFSYFFLVISSFWVLKPLKKGLFVEHYDAEGLQILGWHLRASQAELLAKVLNVAVAFAAMALFTWLSRRLRRQQLTQLFTGAFMACYAVYALVFAAPGPAAVWSFYLFGDLFNTVMVATFFAFLADSVTPEQARRLYGVIGLGGVAGGAFGALVVRAWIDRIPLAGWLWILFAVGAVILSLATVAGKLVARARREEARDEPVAEPAPAKISAAFEGARLVLASRYLLAIVGIVGLYEVVSALADFQFTETVARYLDGVAIREQFSTVYSITTAVALGIQLLGTGFVLKRFGVTTALLVLPVAILVGAAGFLAAPVLWAGSFLSVADNSLNYSINQSAREALYVPTSVRIKYRAKACIDMFIQRFAKAIGVILGLGLSALISGVGGVRWLSLVVVALVVLWIIAARHAGRRFRELEQDAPRGESRGVGVGRPDLEIAHREPVGESR